MTIEELLSLRAELAAAVAQLVKEFEQRTGVVVEGTVVERRDIMPASTATGQARVLTGVRVMLKLA